MYKDYVGDLLFISFIIIYIVLTFLLLSNLKTLNNDNNKNCEICCCNFDEKNDNLHN